MGKEHWLPAGNMPQPVRRLPLMPPQSFVFPDRPSLQYVVEVMESGVARRVLLSLQEMTFRAPTFMVPVRRQV